LRPHPGLQRTTVASFLLVASAVLGVAVGGDDDQLYYVLENGSLVFTNTPAATARPVPGWAPPTQTKPSPRRSSDLPSTVYDPFIDRVARENGLSPSLIKAVALVESGFDPHAVSPKGARGLMQLMPGTARDYGVTDAFDPLQNLRAGSTHLRRLMDQFDGDLTLALAAYNAGAGTVRRHGGVPEYEETREYLRRVKARMGPSSPIRAQRDDGPGDVKFEDVRLVVQPDGSVLLAN
jgi:soluble lytic murein transglycosylase-like protein